MSIISQLGVIILIIVIIFILVRSNRQLTQAAEEGEHFVDEWAMRELKKEEMANALTKIERQEADETEAGCENKMELEKEIITFVELNEYRHPLREIPVTKLPFTIGRAPDNDLVIDELSIAKKHCHIIRKNKSLILEDAGTRNKMAVGELVQKEMILKDNMYMKIGTREFLVKITDL